MRVLVVGAGPLSRDRLAEIRCHAETRVMERWLTDDELPLDGEDALFLEESDVRSMALASSAVKRGTHVFLTPIRSQSIRDMRELARLAEEAGVSIGVSSVFRSLPSVRTVSAPRVRLVSIQSSVGEGEEFLSRLIDWLDVCLSLAGGTEIQKLDAEAVRSDSGAVAAVGVSIRFRNGSMGLLHQERGEGGAILSVTGDEGTRRAQLTRHGIADESAAAVRFETRAFLESVAAGASPAAPLASAVQTLQLAEHVMRRLRKRAVITV